MLLYALCENNIMHTIDTFLNIQYLLFVLLLEYLVCEIRLALSIAEKKYALYYTLSAIFKGLVQHRFSGL